MTFVKTEYFKFRIPEHFLSVYNLTFLPQMWFLSQLIRTCNDYSSLNCHLSLGIQQWAQPRHLVRSTCSISTFTLASLSARIKPCALTPCDLDAGPLSSDTVTLEMLLDRLPEWPGAFLPCREKERQKIFREHAEACDDLMVPKWQAAFTAKK